MKKIRTIIACLILLTSCVIFASCQKGAEKLEFDETSPVVMEIGETYSPNISVLPEKRLADLVLSTSDARVVVISPDKKLVAVGVGMVQIGARIGDASANLVVEVVEKRIKLDAPVGFSYVSGQNRIVWSEVNNANSYDVEVDGVVVAQNVTANFFEIDSNVTKSVRVKANGIGKYSDSNFSDAFTFKNLQSPTNLSFDKTTQTLTWDHDGTAKFRVCQNKILLDAVDTKSCVLSLLNAGVYDICVVAVADENQKDGDALVFDSLRSQSLQITRLGDVDASSITWNPSESLLTWGEVEGAKKYEVVIGDESRQCTTNSLKIDVNSFQRGEYKIKITAISDSDELLVLNSINVAEKTVAITKQLQTPVIQKYDESANKLTLTGFGEATDFTIFSNGQEIYGVYAAVLENVAEITLPVGVFNAAGEYSLTAVSKENMSKFFTQSAPSTPYVITRLAAPTNLRIENGRHFVFSPNKDAQDYKLFVASAEKTLNGTAYDLFDEPEGERFIEVQCIGNGNTILSSAKASLTVTKLSTPVLDFDKNNLILKVENALSDHDYRIQIIQSVYEVDLPNGEYGDLSGKLSEGENVIKVQTLTKENEILSNVAEIDVYQLEEIQNLSHESIGDVSYIKFSTNQKFDNFVVSLGDQTLDYTTSFEGENNSTTVLTLKNKTSQIFATAGEYLLTVEAKSTDPNTINPAAAIVKIKKLQNPTIEFTFPNKFTWDMFDDIDNKFNLVITKEGEIIDGFNTEIEDMDEYVAVGLPLENNLTAKLKVLGDNRNVLDSNFVPIVFDHSKLATPSNVKHENDRLTWDAVEDANEYEIYVGDKEFSSQTNSFETKGLEVGQYSVQIKAKHTADSTISSEASSQYSFIITRKLSVPTNLTFDKSNLRLSWGAVTTDENNASANATNYMVFVDGKQAMIENTSQTTFAFDSSVFSKAKQYSLTVQAFGAEYTQASEKSSELIVEKLAAPTSISIDEEEIVSCAHDSNNDINKVDEIKIWINGSEGNSLKNCSGEIAIKSRFIGKTDKDVKYLDSDYYEETVYRLDDVSGFKLENDIICWNPVSNASGYFIFITPDGKNRVEKFLPVEDTEEDENETSGESNELTQNNYVLRYEYDFEYEGSYKIEIYAKGGTVGGVKYLDSAHETIEAQKCSAPTNVKLEENPTAGIVTITFDYPGAENSTSKFDIYVGETCIGEVSTTTFSCVNSIFLAVEKYSVSVKAIGKNEAHFVSSDLSEAFITTRLTDPYSILTGFDGMDYVFTFLGETTETDYCVEINNIFEVEEEGGTKSQSKTIKSCEISGLSYKGFYFGFYPVYEIDFAKEMQDGEYANGVIQISIYAKGNNTTLLKSVISSNSYSFTPQPTLSYDADKLIIKRASAEYQVRASYKVGESEEIQLKNGDFVYNGDLIEYPIPSAWLPGEYTFVVRQYLNGGVISAPVELKVTRLSNVSRYSLSRDETNSDIIYLSWEEVADATGYVVYVAKDQFATGALQIYNNSGLTMALPLSKIDEGQVFFFFQALGGEGVGFSSQTVWVGSNRVKLYASQLNLRNENGVLTWSEYGVSQLCAGYKLIINGDDENPINLDSTTYSCLLKKLQDADGEYCGKLNIKLKQIGDFVNAWGIDSDYVEINIDKLPAPTNVRVVEGEIEWDFNYNLDDEVKDGEDISFVINVDGKQYAATDEGIKQLASELLADKEYTATLQAKHKNCLTSDESNSITFKILANPETADNSTHISTNDLHTTSWLNWKTMTGASGYEVRIEGGSLQTPILQRVEGETVAKFEIPTTLSAGTYTISVRRIGTTCAQEGVCHLSSGFSTPISFTVLSAPVVSVSNGELAWSPQDGANNYYLYDGDAYKKCGNVTSWTFLGEYINATKEYVIKFKLQAIGDGVGFLASAKTNEIQVVKPRPPQLPTVKNGALCWNNQTADDYTYHDETENKKVFLDFVQNGTTYESFEIDPSNLENGWPLGDNYLQKLTTNLPAGNYTLKIKQIGDSSSVITSEYAEETLEITITPAPTNVKIAVEKDNDGKITSEKLTWDGVALNGYGENPITYVVYVFDSEKNDWVKLTETTDTSLDVGNANGLLEPKHTALAVATKGNATGAGLVDYVTGNMSEKVDIIVLGSTSNLHTTGGKLEWGQINNAKKYELSATQSESEQGATATEITDINSTYFDILTGGVSYKIKVRALGNGEKKNGSYIINGVYGTESSFTKLKRVEDVKTKMTNVDDESLYGSFSWSEIECATGYDVYVGGEFHATIRGLNYESDYGDDNNLIAGYTFRARGNDCTPAGNGGTVAYISSKPSEECRRTRFGQVEGVDVSGGKLHWNVENAYGGKIYFVDFFTNQNCTNKFKRVVFEPKQNDFNANASITTVTFDLEGRVDAGKYWIKVHRTGNSDTYITGIGSDPVEFTILKHPENVRLDGGILKWSEVAGATGYVVRLVSSNNNIIDDNTIEGGNQCEWVSDITSFGSYAVSVRAISTEESILNSAWATKNGKLEGSQSDWTVIQIPQLIVGNDQENEISVEDNNIVWKYKEGRAGVPNSIKYQYKTNNNASIYNIDESKLSYSNITSISIRTLPDSSNTADYFASVFSDWKNIDKPAPPTGLRFDENNQIFTWDLVTGSDVSYLVTYKYQVDEGVQETEETKELSNNIFEPYTPGLYSVQVQVKKAGAGISDMCDAVEGKFDLFNSGEGTSASPFEVNKDNFKNIMFRPNAYFKLAEDMAWTKQPSLGDEENPFLGHLDGDGKTITISINDHTNEWFGLFHTLGKGAEIKNLNVKVSGNISLSVGSTSNIGIIAGTADGATISSCTVDLATSDQSSETESQSSGITLTINVQNDANITFGSIVGQIKNGAKVEQCTNNLSITISAQSLVYAGGIVGQVDESGDANDYDNSTVTGCTNNGNLSGAQVVGGIAGANYGTVSASTNNASIASNISNSNNGKISIAGGIVGNNIGSVKNMEVVGGKVIDCSNTNTATITAKGDGNVAIYASGIVGQTDAGHINNNTARGSISTSGGSNESAAQAIVGNFNSYSSDSKNFKARNLSQTPQGGMIVENINE